MGYKTRDFGKDLSVTDVMTRVEMEPTTGCWLWTGSLIGGYGERRGTDATGKRTRILIHRFMYEQHKGEIPSDLCVCHRCDTPSCVNPAHLFLGTRGDNTADAKAKGHYVRTTCAAGLHLLVPENIRWSKGERICAPCRRAYERARYASRKRQKAQ